MAEARNGDRAALDELFQAVYGEPRRIAHARRGAWHGNETLGTTALVHEAYLKLTRQSELPWRDRGQYFGILSKEMRHRNLLAEIEMARGTLAEKRAAETARVLPHSK